MTAGMSGTVANSLLGYLKNSAPTAYANVYVQLHTGDPGSAGTTSVSGQTTRNAITWNAASGGSMALNTLSTWTMNTSETITHVSLWSASTSGTFLESWALTSGVAVVNNSVLTIGTFTRSFTPIAA